MHSRNNRCGILIGQGKSIDEAVKEVGQVVEGLNALPAAVELAKEYDVDKISDSCKSAKSLLHTAHLFAHSRYFCNTSGNQCRLRIITAAVELAKEYDVDMPIVMTLDKVVKGELDPVTAVETLMSRTKKAEVSKEAHDRFFEEKKIKR